MTTTIIIIVSLLLLCAYLFDITAPRTKIPAVILLLLLGWAVRQAVGLSDAVLPFFSTALPVLGTVGLILIVLEGSLELELHRSRLPLITKSFFGAVIPLLITALVLAWLVQRHSGASFARCMLNVLPLCIISSAIAIPSSRQLGSTQRQFVVYESSFSDIAGVLFFNFIAAGDEPDLKSLITFAGQLVLMICLSLIATIALSLLLSKLRHHVKFVPIILLILLIYSVAKAFHLPSLLFILLFGLFIGNLDELGKFRWVRRLHPHRMDQEVKRFRNLASEATFLIRALFFILFGYLMDTSDLLNTDTLLWSLLTVSIIIGLRAIQLKVSGIGLRPLLFIAPRGLITILLFLSIPAGQALAPVGRSLVTQVIALTSLLMMGGLMLSGNKSRENENSAAASQEDLSHQRNDDRSGT